MTTQVPVDPRVDAVRDRLDDLDREWNGRYTCATGTGIATDLAFAHATRTYTADGVNHIHLVTAALVSGTVRVDVTVIPDTNDDYWSLYSTKHARPGDVIIGGTVYGIGDGKGLMRGFAGHTFRLRRLADGAEVTTNDLWKGMTIPPVWRDRIPNTHEFIDA